MRGPGLAKTIVAAFVLLGLHPGCAGWAGKKVDDVRVGIPPSALDLDPFYRKHVDLDGLPILASDRVPDRALLEARGIIIEMVSHHPELLPTLVKNGVRVVVMAESEQTTDVPEHSDLTPKENWDRRARGLGATHARPVCSCAEENLLGYPTDRYLGENILIHEFAHTLHTMAIVEIDETFGERLERAYARAMEEGLWANTYAATNAEEYWAEGVQSWFDANREAPKADGVHNEVNTRRELEEVDPALAGLISEWFPVPRRAIRESGC